MPRRARPYRYGPTIDDVPQPRVALQYFLDYHREHPPPPPTPEQPLPKDLASIAEASQLCRMSKQTIYNLINKGFVRAWGTRRLRRVSLSELMPETSIRTWHTMVCVICHDQLNGRPGERTGWKFLELSPRRQLFVCPRHFPPPPIHRESTPAVRDPELRAYQEASLHCWRDIIARVIEMVEYVPKPKEEEQEKESNASE